MQALRLVLLHNRAALDLRVQSLGRGILLGTLRGNTRSDHKTRGYERRKDVRPRPARDETSQIPTHAIPSQSQRRVQCRIQLRRKRTEIPLPTTDKIRAST